MMLFIKILTVLPFLLISECSRVMDRHSHGINITEYCAETSDCAEGMHVMCRFYNPNRLMGPMCADFDPITITPEYAELILNIINRVRSKVARGTSKGDGGVRLPRGYGIYRMSWDEELATFAQIWANQCTFQKDSCFATNKFPHPSQMLGMVRYTVEDWMPINSNNIIFNSSDLTPEKVKYAIVSVLRAWYQYRENLNVEDVFSYNKSLVFYPYLMYGFATHIGCGISAYRNYMYKIKDESLSNFIYNTVLVVCNFSARGQKHQSVYTIAPPTVPGYTVKCGCPIGYDEDEDCLCYKTGRQLPYSCKANNRCRPSVVVLPIFSVEDAPKKDYRKNESILMDSTNEIFDRYDMFQQQLMPNDFNSLFNNLQNLQPSTANTTIFPLNVKRRYFSRIPKNNLNHLEANVAQHKKLNNLRSIFSKSAIFELPYRKQSSNKNHIQKYKKDVEPRKDFSKAQQLLLKYFKNKKKNLVDVEEYTIQKYEVTTTSYIKTSTKTTQNYLEFTKSQVDAKSTTDSDKKLLTLLDTLEREVKNIDINKNDKDALDARIRKIYGSIVDKSFSNHKEILSEKMTTSTDFQNDLLYKNKDYLDLHKPNDYENHKERHYGRVSSNKEIFNENNTMLDLNVDKRQFYEDDRNFKRGQIKREFDDINDDENYPLSFDRRRFYQNKLETLQRKLEVMKRHGYRNDVNEDRKIRPFRPTKTTAEFSYRKRKEPENTFYIPDRARFLHGY